MPTAIGWNCSTPRCSHRHRVAFRRVEDSARALTCRESNCWAARVRFLLLRSTATGCLLISENRPE